MFLLGWLFLQGCSSDKTPEEFGYSYCTLLEDCELLSYYNFDNLDHCAQTIATLTPVVEMNTDQLQSCLDVHNSSSCEELYDSDALGQCDPFGNSAD